MTPSAGPTACHRRGSVLVTALLISTVLGVALVGYLLLSRTALKLSHRTLFVNDASNLAEAGLEEALYCFNQVSAGVAKATAWSGWTISGSTARRTLPQFNRDQNGIGTVKVFVNDYDNGGGNPYIISQATLTPFDGGAPLMRVMRIGMKQSGNFINGLVALKGLDLKGQPFIDSFNSNPTNSPTGPWLPYSAALSAANTTVIVPTGKVDLGNGQIKGNMALGPGVTAPPASQVSGTIQMDFAGEFKMPAYPTSAGVSQSYNLGSNIPTVLPVSGHTPASDGRYYYFTHDVAIAKTTITAGSHVMIVGTKTTLDSVTIQDDATCAIYIDGKIEGGKKGALSNNSWAGALQVYTTSKEDCTISGNGELRASLFAPNAALKASGGGSSGALTGAFVAKTVTATGHMSFHYDEALKYLTTVGGSGRWKVASWSEVRLDSDLSALRAATGNFLP